MNSKIIPSKKILIITYEMIPFANSWGGCQRMYYLAESLISQDYIVWVASCKLTQNPNYYDQSINFKQIIIDHPIKHLQSNTFKEVGFVNRNIFYHLKSVIKNFIYKIDKFLLNEPNVGMGILSYVWIKKAFRELKSTMIKNDIDKVIISGPPFTLFLFAQKLKKSFKSLKIIVDYRDPWNLWNNRKFPSLFFEKKYLKSVDLVTVTTDTLQYGLKQILGITNCETIYNGFSSNMWSKAKPLSKKINDKIIISYIGSIDFQKGSYRDTTVFFEAYNKFKDKELLEIRFVGITESEILVELKSKFPEIVFIKKVPVSKAIEIMMESDYLLNIHTANDDSSKYLMGGKIFDYLRSGNKIISINDSNSFEHKFLETKHAFLCTNDETKILKVFNQIVHEKYQSSKNNISSKLFMENINVYSRENQNMRYIKLIENLTDARLKK